MIWTAQNSSAVFSPCRRYRYSLTRILAPSGPSIAFIGLNPSTADEHTDDPTVARCWRFAQRWGYARFTMLNLFAFRATDPRVMLREPEPIGEGNDITLAAVTSQVNRVVCCWGNHGVHLERFVAVRQLQIARPGKFYCFKLTKLGQPQHPLYLRNDSELVPW